MVVKIYHIFLLVKEYAIFLQKGMDLHDFQSNSALQAYITTQYPFHEFQRNTWADGLDSIPPRFCTTHKKAVLKFHNSAIVNKISHLKERF